MLVQDHGQSSYHWVSFRQVLSRLVPLILAEWEEVSPYKDIAELDPDYSQYFQIENMGRLRTLVAVKNGDIAGFAIFVISRNLHCNLIGAYVDTFYVLSEYRNSKIGIGLFRRAIEKAKEEKVNYLLSDASNATIEKIYKHLGFEFVANRWAKWM